MWYKAEREQWLVGGMDVKNSSKGTVFLPILIKTPSCMGVKRTTKAMEEGRNIITAKEPSTTGEKAIKWVSQQDNNALIHVLNYLRVIRHIPLTVPRPIVFIKQIFRSIYLKINPCRAHQRRGTPLEYSHFLSGGCGALDSNFYRVCDTPARKQPRLHRCQPATSCNFMQLHVRPLVWAPLDAFIR